MRYHLYKCLDQTA